MKSTVSVRWQTVIPQEARDALRIEPNSKLEWEVHDGYMVVYPVPADPLEAARLAFSKLGWTEEELQAEREAERELEARREELLRGAEDDR
jgi:AbrB family looped-hinge helix DNA binding protein